MNYFYEIYYTIYPIAQFVALAPLWFFIYGTYRLYEIVSSTNLSYEETKSLSQLLIHIFAVIGGVFSIYFVSHLRVFINSFFKKAKKVKPIGIKGIKKTTIIFSFISFLSLIYSLQDFLTEPNSIWIISNIFLHLFATIGVPSLLFIIFRAITNFINNKIKRTSPNLNKVFSIIRVLLLVYPFFVLFMLLHWLFYNPLSKKVAYHSHHVLNAAVKNTCFIDPGKENCPKKLEDIKVIQEKEYLSTINNSQINYIYNQKENIYSLVIRYSPIRAAVFDPRLIETGNGSDYKEYDVSILGKDRIKNPPNFEGPWSFDEWSY